MIHAVVFDAVGTVMHVRPSVEAVYAEVGRRFGSRVSIEEIGRRFREVFAEQDRVDQEAEWRTSEARERERWRTIVARVFDDVADAEGCFSALYAAFAQANAWAFDPDWERISTVCYQLGLRQAIASNFDERLRGLVQTAPHSDWVDPLIISSEIGWRKPAPEFFACLIETLHLLPAAILFVGDDFANDYEPALRAGMRPILFDPANRHGGGIERIARLGELADMLRG